jgi:hypothetical protein
VNFFKVGELAKGTGVTERNEADAVVSEGREGGNRGALLTTTRGSRADKETRGLARELTALPELTSGVDESLCDR